MLYIPSAPSPEFKRTDNNPPGYKSPLDKNIPFKDLQLKTSDNLKIHAWIMTQTESNKFPTLLFFHANAGNMGLRMELIQQFYYYLKVNIMIFDQRGYGLSDGEPSEDGLHIDAITAWDYLINQELIDNEHIFLFGRSLGGAVAIWLAHHIKQNSKKYSLQPKGIILENTFTSIGDMVDCIFPIQISFFKSLILRIKWNSIDLIKTLNCPILFFSGTDDEIVPPKLMRLLFNSTYLKSINEFKLIKNGKHNDTFNKSVDTYIRDAQKFIEKCLKLNFDQFEVILINNKTTDINKKDL